MRIWRRATIRIYIYIYRHTDWCQFYGSPVTNVTSDLRGVDRGWDFCEKTNPGSNPGGVGIYCTTIYRDLSYYYVFQMTSASLHALNLCT